MDEKMSRVNRLVKSMAAINEWVLDRVDINRTLSGVCVAYIWIQGIEKKVLRINSDGMMNWEER